VLSQPTLIGTQALAVLARRAGSALGKTSSASSSSTCDACSTRARSSSTGSDPTLWVPKTTST
jgi:hypothetical protein